MARPGGAGAGSGRAAWGLGLACLWGSARPPATGGAQCRPLTAGAQTPGASTPEKLQLCCSGGNRSPGSDRRNSSEDPPLGRAHWSSWLFTTRGLAQPIKLPPSLEKWSSRTEWSGSQVEYRLRPIQGCDAAKYELSWVPDGTKVKLERPWGMLLSNVGCLRLGLEDLEDPQEMHLLILTLHSNSLCPG